LKFFFWVLKTYYASKFLTSVQMPWSYFWIVWLDFYKSYLTLWAFPSHCRNFSKLKNQTKQIITNNRKNDVTFEGSEFIGSCLKNQYVYLEEPMIFLAGFLVDIKSDGLKAVISYSIIMLKHWKYRISKGENRSRQWPNIDDFLMPIKKKYNR
jgi:hypothetical protein